MVAGIFHALLSVELVADLIMSPAQAGRASVLEAHGVVPPGTHSKDVVLEENQPLLDTEWDKTQILKFKPPNP